MICIQYYIYRYPLGRPVQRQKKNISLSLSFKKRLCCARRAICINNKKKKKKATQEMPALTKRSLATRLARLEKKLGVDIHDEEELRKEQEEEDALKKENDGKGGSSSENDGAGVKSLKDVLEAHVSGLSADGLEYVWFDTSMPLWTRFIIGLVLFASFGTMLFLINETVAEYRSYPFATNIQFEERRNARWPAIIFCPNHAELSRDKMEKIVEGGVERYSDAANKTFMKSMVRKCEFFGLECGEDEIDQYWTVENLGERYGICLEFNYKDKVNDEFCAEDENGETHETDCLFGLYGNQYGLNVFLDPLLQFNSIDESDPYTGATALYDAGDIHKRYHGVYVEIHGTKHEAMPTFSSVLSAVGQATFISMSERETRRLGKPYHEKECSKDPLYSKSVCITACEEDIHDKCQYDTTKTLEENLHGADSKYHACYNREMASEICQCDEQCESDEFIPIVSTTEVHPTASIDATMKPSTDLNDYANVHVYYNALNLEVIEELPVFNFFVFIGVIFGHIGFFTGFNLISVTQIAVCIIHLLKRIVAKKY